MIRYTVRRLLFLLPQLLAVITLTFVIVQFTPGNPARAQLGSQAPQEAVDRLAEDLGLNDPTYQQYVRYVGNVSQGDLGVSWISGKPVLEDLARRGPATIELITVGFLVSLLVAVPLGVATATATEGWRHRITDRFSFVYGLMAGAIPDFWFALILVLVFFHFLGISASPIGQLDLDIPEPDRVTGMLLIDSVLDWNWSAFRNHVSHLILPAGTLVFINAAPILRMTRNNVQDNIRSDFIRFARANGLPSRQIVRYALRNALPPIITLAGVLYTILIAGAVLTETIYSWGGVGQYAVQSVLNADWSALQGVVLAAALISLIVYLLLDLMHAAIDPRVRH